MMFGQCEDLPVGVGVASVGGAAGAGRVPHEVHPRHRDRGQQPRAEAVQVWRGLGRGGAAHISQVDNNNVTQILDYDQFYLNLTDVIAGGQPEWRLAYTMLEHFGMDTLSVANLAEHVQKVIIIIFHILNFVDNPW